MVERISGRRVCSATATSTTSPTTRRSTKSVCDQDGKPLAQRDDDREDAVAPGSPSTTRPTEPAIDYYEQNGLLRRFDGTRTVTEVHDHIRATLATLRLEERL